MGIVKAILERMEKIYRLADFGYHMIFLYNLQSYALKYLNKKCF